MGSIKEGICLLAGSETVMELRLFRLLCLAATALTLSVIVPAELMMHLSIWTAIIDLAFGLATFFLYLEACRGCYRLRSLFFLYLLNQNLSWFAKDGSQGSVILYFFTAFIYALIYFRGRTRLILLGTAVTDAIALIVAEQYVPGWLVPYQSESARLADLTLALLLSAFTCSLMLWAVLTSYDREQQRLKSLNADLEENMAERLEAEHSLRQNRELLNAVIEGTSDAVFAKDVAGRYVLFNSGAARITGKNVAQALGKDDSFLFPYDEARSIMEWDRAILRSGEMRSIEEVITNGCGEKVVVQATKGPLRDEQGSIVGVFGISRDVTENRRVEQEIRLLNAELDLRVTERTARLEAAIQEQESFCYSVSHDLRAPLRHINSYSAILQEECAECLSPEVHGYLERIRISSRNMGKLIDDLLELSRVGRSPLQKTEVNLSELTGAIAFRLQRSEPERRAVFSIAPELTARGDRTLLGLVLVNLLENAWKYTSREETARIELGFFDRKGRQAFFVRDNGVGFDMAYGDKLFGAFQRLHGSEFEGTGIGLAMVKRIVKRHGGKVWAEGALGEGATFYFTLG
jgi:PAS domain S-box-containing protein